MNLRALSIGLTSALLVLSAGCGKGGLTDLNEGDGMNKPNPTELMIDRIEVNPATITLLENAAVTIEVVGFKSDNSTVTLTEGLTWASANEAVAQVSADGTVTASGPGDTTIDVKYHMLSAVVQVSVTDAKLTALTINPDQVTTAVGGVTQFQAAGLLDDGSVIDLTAVSSWSSSSPNIVSIDAGGLATAAAGGSAMISAEFSGEKATATIEVSEAKVVSLRVSPDSATLAPQSVQAFTVTAFLDDGTQADLTAAAQWTSSDTAVISIVAGLATAHMPGDVTVTAKIGEVTGEAKVTVTAYRLVSIRIEPTQDIVLELGDEQALRAIGVYENQDEVDLSATAQWASSNDRAVSVSNAPGQQGKISAISPGEAQITATVGMLSGNADVVVSEARLLSLEFDANSVSIREGATEALRAFGNYSDMSRRDVTAQVNWTSSNTQIATVINTGADKGTIQALSQGETTITITLDGVTADISVVVAPPGLVDIVVTPANQTIEEDTRLNYQAEGVYSNGNRADITTDVTWSVADPNIADISNVANAEGLLISRDNGNTQVRATFDGVTGETDLTVVPPTLVEIQITPVNPTMNIGEYGGLGATAVYSNATTRNISRDAQWSSSNTMVVEVNSSRMGAYTEAIGAGMAVITATFQGISATSTFTVNDAAVVSLSIDPIIWTAPVGDDRRFSVQAFYSNGSSQDITWMANWSSSDSSVASVGGGRMGQGRVEANSPGTAQITASYDGLQVSSTVTVTPAVITSIQVTPFMASMTVGQDRQFQAVAIMSDGTTENITNDASWISTDLTVAGVSNSRWSRGRVTAIAAGTTTIRASLDGTVGETALSVSNASIDRIQVTPFIPTVPLGYGLQMRATVIFTDGTTLDITNASSWSTSDITVAAVSNARGSEGRITTLSAGMIAVNAQYMGVTGTTDLTVSSAVLTGITVTPDVATVTAGQSVDFNATGNFDDGSTFNVTWYVTWNSSDLTVADVSNAWGSWGQATGFATGTASIVATQGMVSGSANLTVQ
jgi:hypothetical protein